MDREEAVLQALRGVVDPEVGLDIVTMGLVYGVEVRDASVRVRFTLTIQGCPMEGHITHAIREAVSSVPGVKQVETELVWEPRWHPRMIEERA